MNGVAEESDGSFALASPIICCLEELERYVTDALEELPGGAISQADPIARDGRSIGTTRPCLARVHRLPQR